MNGIKIHMLVKQTFAGKVNMIIAKTIIHFGVIGKGKLISGLLCNKINYKYKLTHENKWRKLDMSDRFLEVTKG